MSNITSYQGHKGQSLSINISNLPSTSLATSLNGSLNLSSYNASSPYQPYEYSYNPEADIHEIIENIIYERIVLIVCLFGLLGNILNLIVLTRKSLVCRMDRMERSAHLGLIALATSDFLFCLTAFPHSLHDRNTFDYASVSFWLVYTIYGNAVINVFIMSSTWLTVSMAISRYLAICFPLQGRQVIGVTFSRIAIVLVFVFCVLFNLPRFFEWEIASIQLGDDEAPRYYPTDGPLRRNIVAEKTYMWFYFLVCIVIPLIVLTYCNFYLVRALQKSAKMRRQHTRNRNSAPDNANIVTLTLSVIVALYIILVIPAEVLNFARNHVVGDTHSLNPLKYNLAVAICNALQAVNFACNFVLYCIINVHFRKSIKRLLHCQKFQTKRWASKYDSMTMSYTNEQTIQTAVSRL